MSYDDYDYYKLVDYELCEIVNDAHMVYLVRHRETNCLCIMKVCEEYNVNIFAALKSNPVPGTPTVREFYEKNGRLVVYEDFIYGETVRNQLDNNHVYSSDEILIIMNCLCETLGRLHKMRPPVIHRDIKPGNIIIDAAKMVWLIDFNAARFDEGQKESDTRLLGTPGYASPEQFGFRSTDARSDIYSAGMLLKELTEHADEKVKKNAALADVIKKSTELEAGNRYFTAEQLRAAVLAAFNRSRLNIGEDKRRFFPPGFRQGNPLHMITAFFGYLLLMAVCAGVYQVEGSSGSSERDVLLKTIIVIWIILAFLFVTNYLDIQSHIKFFKKSPGDKSLPLFVRVYLIIAELALSFFIMFFVVVLVNGLADIFAMAR